MLKSLRKKSHWAWESALKELGCKSRPTSAFRPGQTACELNGLPVEIQALDPDGVATTSRITVGNYKRIHSRLVARPRGANRAAKHEDRDLIDVGDEELTVAVALEGAPEEVLARLDADARRRLVHAMRYGGTRVEDSSVVRLLQRPKTARVAAAHVSELVELALSLGLEGSVSEALVRNIREDPLGAVRACNLSVLQSSFPGQTADAASHEAASDRDARVRLQAAEHLGTEEPVPVLLQLVRPSPAGEGTDSEAMVTPVHVRAEALRHSSKSIATQQR